MSDATFSNFSEEISNLPLPQLESLYALIGKLILVKKRKETVSSDEVKIPKEKQAFFDAVGKLYFDTDAIDSLRKESMI